MKFDVSILKSCLASVFLVALFLFACKTDSSEADTSKLPDQDVHFVVLEGSPYYRGMTYGKSLKKEINELVNIWKTQLESEYNVKLEDFTERFFQETDFLPAIKKWTPDLLEEVRGISDGAEIDFNTMLLFQLPDEQWVNAGLIFAEKCSGIGINKQGKQPAMIAQNMDLPGFYDGYQTLLHIKYPESDKEVFVFTFAGLIGANGMNNKSVGVTVNTLSQLKSSIDGLPVAFVVRGLLEKNNQESAIEFLHQVKHASGQNYIIGGREQVYDFECSSNKVVKYTPFETAKFVYHTNHPLTNDDYSESYYRWLASNNSGEKVKANTKTRFESLERSFNGYADVIDVDAFQATLKLRDSDKFPVCRPYRNERLSFTFGSTIMIFSEESELRLAIGPPDKTDYVTYTFSSNSKVARQ